MNQEFLLKTDVPMKTVQQSAVAATSAKGDELESQARPAFSSELDKQIDKQISPETTVETAQTAESTVQNTQTEPDLKAEGLTDKNGNPLPTNQVIAEQFVVQWLDDFEGTPEQKQQLTELITQFIDDIVNDVDPELDLEQRVATFVAQLEEIKTALSNPNQTADLKIEGVTEEVLINPAVKPLIAADGELKNTVLAETKQLQPDKVATPQVAVSTEQKQASKETLPQSNQTVLKANIVNDDGTKERLATASERQDKRSAQTNVAKTDKVAVISDLVKQLFPEKTAPTTAKAPELVQTQTEAAKTNPGVALRPDILQALTGGDKSTIKTDKVVTVANLQTDLTIGNDKKADRIVQLVELLKPAKADDKPLATWDKSLLSQTATTSPSTTANTGTSATPKTTPTLLDVQPALNSKAWDRVVSSRVVWMATEGVQQAALKLNPAHLGPVEVRVNVHNEQVNVSFVAQNAATRDALEQALPRLRESFSENGLELTDAGVSDQASQQMKDEDSEQANNNNNQDGTVAAKTNADDQSEHTVVGVQKNIELGVNVYA